MSIEEELLDVLLVEDNPGDVRLAREALKEGKLHVRLHVVSDGEAACDYLFQRGRYEDARRPDLILLDLNLPLKNGQEVLKEIKADDSLKIIPVVVLTTSEAEEDVMQSYSLHANCFVSKPLGLGEFQKVVKSIEQFWFTIVKLPEGTAE
ncbi:MAG: response regulator [Verrucomicrobia bacterium]|nr:response regulator [Verrucomicrobiota bacterium]MCH8528325.1 response regulator [Kiritimatiellia bacterium]